MDEFCRDVSMGYNGTGVFHRHSVVVMDECTCSSWTHYYLLLLTHHYLRNIDKTVLTLCSRTLWKWDMTELRPRPQFPLILGRARAEDADKDSLVFLSQRAVCVHRRFPHLCARKHDGNLLTERTDSCVAVHGWKTKKGLEKVISVSSTSTLLVSYMNSWCRLILGGMQTSTSGPRNLPWKLNWP